MIDQLVSFCFDFILNALHVLLSGKADLLFHRCILQLKDSRTGTDSIQSLAHKVFCVGGLCKQFRGVNFYVTPSSLLTLPCRVCLFYTQETLVPGDTRTENEYRLDYP